MKRAFHVAIVGVIGVQALILGQGPEAARVLSEMRAALGGDKVASVRAFSATGRSARTLGQFQLTGDIDIQCELPDKYVKREELSMGAAAMSNTLGFNGETLIRHVSQPATTSMGHGTVMMRPAGSAAPGTTLSEAQQAAMNASLLRNARAEFTRYTVAFFGASFAGSPVEFTYGGQAESPDGKADIIDVKGADDFHARLFVDGRSRRPLMMSWKAPNAQVVSSGMRQMQVPAGQGVDRDRMIEDRLKELTDAAMQLVEHRLYFSDYRDVDGVRLPHQIVRAIDGTTSEELTIERFRLNPKIDPKQFK